jgi:hypothetical protein
MGSKDIITDICERMDLLRLRHGAVFGGLSPAVVPFIPIAEALARGLGAEEPDAVRAARSLVDPGELAGPQFWGSPFGRLLFLAGGWDGDTLSQTHAAALLGCSRQWVHALVEKGDLGAAPGAPGKPGARPVYASHVLAFMKAKIDMAVNLL